MKIAATGFVASEAGSIASANAILLKGLLERGHQVDFFSKPSFVDPRSVVGEHPHFCFHECTNRVADTLRRLVQRIPVLGFLGGRFDATTYNRLLLHRIAEVNRSASKCYDVVLWMGDYAHGRVQGVPSVSFGQGAPGTDARSILRRKMEIRKLAGPFCALRLEVLARLRLSPVGLPDFRHSDHIIVGSNQSKRTLVNHYKIETQSVSTMPYPVDLELFRPPARALHRTEDVLRVLWLGRIVPRKRLDLFLDGGAEAIRRGVNVMLTVVGGVGFVSGYERIVEEFPFPARLKVLRGVPRQSVPDLLARHDVLCQPSEEEDFGSAVAEAQACGLPVIVGQTNGNADYLCERDTHLRDYRPQTLSEAFSTVSRRLAREDKTATQDSRRLAERSFDLPKVVDGLEAVLISVIEKNGRN